MSDFKSLKISHVYRKKPINLVIPINKLNSKNSINNINKHDCSTLSNYISYRSEDTKMNSRLTTNEYSEEINNISFSQTRTKLYTPSKSIIKDSVFTKDRKVLKSKLLNLIKDNIIFTNDKVEVYNRSKSDRKLNKIDKSKTYRHDMKINIITQKKPELINNSKLIVSRYEDMYITPEELILNNFKKEEINIIKTNLEYFSLDKFELSKSELLKPRNLLENFIDEDKVIKIINSSNNKLDKKDYKYLNDSIKNIGSNIIKVVSKEKNKKKKNFMTLKDHFYKAKY